MVKERIKQWYQSKTIWLALLQAAVGVLTAVLTQYPELEAVALIAVGKSMIDIALRLVTQEKLQ